MRRNTKPWILLCGKTKKITGLVTLVFLYARVAEAKQSIKYIKSEDGDIIDCIDIHKQPAFGHPLLKNHTIEMKPRYLPPHKATNKASSAAIQQVWHKSGNCPNGTIPIRRTKRKHKLALEGEQPTGCQSEVAGIQATETMYGARADINVWNVSVEANEWSSSCISIYNGQGSFIQYGWMASPTLYDDDGQTRLFIRWDKPGRHGCFNLECPGFVQVTDRLALGATLVPTSEPGGSQFEAQLAVYEDGSSGRWWALYGQVVVGYWPAEALGQTAAAFRAGARATWGGEVCGVRRGGAHTTTQMGSGLSPIDVKGGSWGRTAYVHGMEAMDRDGRWRRPQDVAYGISSPDCYQAKIYEPSDRKLSAYFGGPGDQCFDGARL